MNERPLTEEVVVLSIVVILAAGGVGYFIGKSLEAAQEAHSRFTSYRARTMTNLSMWLSGTVKAFFQVAVVVFVLYLLFTIGAL